MKIKIHYDYVEEAGLEASEAVFDALPDIPQAVKNQLQNDIIEMVDNLCEKYFEIFESGDMNE